MAKFCNINAPAPIPWFKRKIVPVFLLNVDFLPRISFLTSLLKRKQRPVKNPPILIHINPDQNGWFKYTFLVRTKVKANRKADIDEILKLLRDIFFSFSNVIKKLPRIRRQKARISFVPENITFPEYIEININVNRGNIPPIAGTILDGSKYSKPT